MRSALLNSKFSKSKGYHFSKKIPIDIESDSHMEYAVPFNFGFVNSNIKYDFNVPAIRTVGNEFLIQTFRDLDFKSGDVVMFDHKYYNVESVRISFFNSTKYKVIKQYFITLK